MTAGLTRPDQRVAHLLHAASVTRAASTAEAPSRLDLAFRAPVRPGDVITGTVEVTSVRPDKPITGLDVPVTREDGVVAVEGTAVCYTVVPG